MKSALQNFLESLKLADPPGQSCLLDSVWYGLKGSWDKAHDRVQEQSGIDAAWIHAWLHRMEGDLSNARYWYGQAGRELCSGDLHAEGEAIAAELLARG